MFGTLLIRPKYVIMTPAVVGIKRYRDPSVCLSHGAAVLGAQLP